MENRQPKAQKYDQSSRGQKEIVESKFLMKQD